MDIAKEVFMRKMPVFDRLKAAGFYVVKRGSLNKAFGVRKSSGRVNGGHADNADHLTDIVYAYSGSLMSGSLTALIVVDKGGNVYDSVIDSDTGDEYLPLNIESYTGSYVGKAREEYRALLNWIAERCFTDVEFVSNQMNRIALEIERRYSAPPEHPFKGSDSAVFRNASSNKWFALVMLIDRRKLDDPNKTAADDPNNPDDPNKPTDPNNPDDPNKTVSDGPVEVMNVKVDPEKVDDLLKMPGICRCYHMSKKYWVTLTMDDRLSDDQVLELVRRSFQLTTAGSSSGQRSGSHDRPDGARRYWLIPSNPANFDVAEGFRESGNDTLAWHHRINVLPGDIVYIYQTEPVASIMFECEVLESFLPRPESWDGYAKNSKYRMTLILLRSFQQGEYPRSWLNEHGVMKTVRGQRSAPDALVEALSKE